MLLEEMRSLQQKLKNFMSMTTTLDKLVAANDAYHYLMMHPHLITEDLKLTLHKKIPEMRLQINQAIRKNLIRATEAANNHKIVEETIHICNASYTLETTFQTIESLYM